MGDVPMSHRADDEAMLTQISNQMADAVASAAPSVVQVNGGRRPRRGLVYANDVVLPPMRGGGQHEPGRVRGGDGPDFPGDLPGWDPATQLPVRGVAGLGLA